jgi:hypothetical protein
MQEILPECRVLVYRSYSITRVESVVCRSLPECRMWYAGSTPAAVVGGIAELAHLYYSVENLELVK